VYVTLANLSPDLERQTRNQHLVAILSPTASRDAVLALVIQSICVLEERGPIQFRVGSGSTAITESFMVSCRSKFRLFLLLKD
jgi:hypothetical protein